VVLGITVVGWFAAGWIGAMAPVIIAFALVGVDRTQFPFEDPLVDLEPERGGVPAAEYILEYERSVWRTLGRPLDRKDLVMAAGVVVVIVFAFLAT
jgi:hypothetical protein